MNPLTTVFLCSSLTAGVAAVAQPPASAEPERHDIVVAAGTREIAVTLLSPSPDQLAPDPALLLTFSADREIALFIEPDPGVPESGGLDLVQHRHR